MPARHACICLLVFVALSSRALAATVSGNVRNSTSGISAARVTLATSDLSFFREARSDAAGGYSFTAIPSGNYLLGASAVGYEYREIPLSVSGSDLSRDFLLGADSQMGRWTIIGNTSPEALFASNSASLLPDGRIFFCHDTEEPVLFDPVTGAKTFPPRSPSQQGCHIPTVLADGRLAFFGGQGTDDFRDAVRTAKAFDPSTMTWEVLPLMFEERWYPGMARLSDGRPLLMGGGQRPNAQRTPTCEIYDPLRRTWTRTGSMSRASDYPPSVLLFTGEVLRTWYPPQLYDPATGQWRDTGQFVQPDRLWPGHCDHSMVVLPDGRAMVCGVTRGSLVAPSMVELYDPQTEQWSLGATPPVTRAQTEVVLLPDGTVLSAGGRLEDPNSTVPTNEFGETKIAEIYDSVLDRWRRVADMNYFREYHATTLLVPDGRVVTTAGTGSPAFPGISNDIEAFEPPYLLRGIRPRIESVSTTDLVNGEPFTMTVSRTSAVTSVVLIGTSSVTHWVDGGVPRLLRLPFTQTGDTVEATVPVESNRAPVGFYILYAMVDDIPSVGKIVRVDPGPRIGNVNAAAGVISDVLFVNGSSGDSGRRWVTLAPTDRLTITMATPPSRTVQGARFALYVSRGFPTSATRTRQRRGATDLGDACFPTPFSGGAPQPLRIANNWGRENILGVASLPSTPAPSVVIDRSSGIGRAIDVTLQAIVRDDASLSGTGASLSNAVLLRVR
ncbi:MAG: DUF1929 domain-containing protein [Planctomycetes bacterium]|nr:DUF1929 domain-containing protein [Planctomycetota bacterium]